MATRFFEHQDQARRATWVLLVCMAMAVFFVAVAMYFLLVGFRKVEPAVFDPTGAIFHHEEFAWWQPDFFMATLAAVGGTVTLAALARSASLRGGGRAVAEMLGGRLVSPQTTDRAEKRLMNVVEEMAIASGVPIPQVFVLERETSINAFAAGFGLSDAAVAVTRGTLDHLTRDELQGVIAHEFSHILNGDMKLNLRLMGIVYGIVCIATLGRMLLRFGDLIGGDHSGRRSKGGDARVVMWILGSGAILIGLIGEFFGNLIKAAVSRQREYLADASAVQFTRNPSGLSNALKKIGGLAEGSIVRSPNASEASHFFFADGMRHHFTTLFATHPPLLRRIRRIDPSFQGPYDVTEPLPSSDRALELAGVSQLASEIGTVHPHAIRIAHDQLRQLPPPIANAVGNPFSACATVYAMVFSHDPAVRQAQEHLVLTTSGEALLHETRRVRTELDALEPHLRLTVVDRATEALRELAPSQQTMFRSTVDGLIQADNNLSVLEYVVLHTVTRRVREAHAPRRRSNREFKSVMPVHAECRLVLTVLAYADTADDAHAQRSYERGARSLGIHEPLLAYASARSISALGPALDTIRKGTREVRQQVLEGCLHTILADNFVSQEQADLLRVIGDALDLPVPILRIGAMGDV
jgi:Zn-dependent protease with chaperone function